MGKVEFQFPINKKPDFVDCLKYILPELKKYDLKEILFFKENVKISMSKNEVFLSIFENAIIARVYGENINKIVEDLNLVWDSVINEMLPFDLDD